MGQPDAEERASVNSSAATALVTRAVRAQEHRKEIMTKAKWKFVSDYPITNYKCGLRASDQVRLKKDLIEVDYKNKDRGIGVSP